MVTPPESPAVPATASTASAAAARLSRRPVQVWAAAVFLTLAALPAAVFGGLLAAQPGAIGLGLRARIDAGHSTLSTPLLLGLARVGGVLVLVLALALLVATWLTARPRRGARTVTTALAVAEIALVVVGMLLTSVDAVSVGIALLAAAGVVLLRLPGTSDFLRR